MRDVIDGRPLKVLTNKQGENPKHADDCDEPGVVGRVTLEFPYHEKVGDLTITLAEPGVKEISHFLGFLFFVHDRPGVFVRWPHCAFI
jgi:hypothetical protein